MARGRRFGIAGVSVAVAAVGVLTAGILTAATAGATTCTPGVDCYQLSVSQATAVAGASNQAFTFTVTDQTSDDDDPLGSVQITAPANFVVTGASIAAGAPTAAAAVSSGSVALFTNLGLGDNQIAELTVDVTAPCTGAGTSWTVQPGETTDFSGINGDNDNDAAEDFQPSYPAMNGLTGTCSLAFQHGAVKAGPVAAEPGSAIPSVVGTPASTNPVSVQVLDGNGNPISALDVPITITADQNSSPVTVLSGTTSGETNGQGTASFDDLIISQTGSFYQLVATTTPGLGIAAGTSSDFEILNDLQGCTGAPCSGSASTTTTSGAATTSSATSGQFLGVGIGGATFACGGSYQPVSDPLTFDVLNSSGAISNATVTVMLTISKQLVQSSGHPGASSWQICFGSDVPFTAQPGTAETYTVGPDSYFYTGLLPDCNKNQTNAPCVVSRHKGNAGVEEVTFVGYGDMNGRA